ncbi:MAG TPA: hypothetical protein VJO33_18735 [Gemmatimonadaceae bacterium]|nr:hypothetical protein [Gemmatimonadaceae bacterium]
MVVLVIAIVAWLTSDRWLPRVTGHAPVAASTGPVWEPLTPQGAERTRQMLTRLSKPTGPVFGNLSGGDVASYVFESLSKQLPQSADSVEAAVIGDRLYIRASVRLQELGGTSVLGPLAGMLGDRERMEFGGTFHVIRPQLAEYEVKDIKLRDLSIPAAMIPRVLRQSERGSRPEGLSPDGLPLVVPSYLGDVRVANGRVTLYKTVPQ